MELKWNAVEKRVSAMIAQGRFLSEDDRAALPQYEKHQLARNIHTFFENVPQEQPHPYPFGFDYWDAVKLIEPQLDDPARVEEIYQMMVPVWEATPQDDRMYKWRQTAFENLSAFRQGTFTLFAEHKEPAAPAMPPEKAYDLGYGHLGNGLTVWNRLEEEHGDYKTVAHIAPDRTVQFYDEEMPQTVRDQIQHIADTSEMTVSATQDAPVFHTPPKVQEPPQKEEAADPYSKLAAQVLYFIGEFDGSRMGYGDTDAQAVETIAEQLHDPARREEIRRLLQSFLDHADPEEEIAADITLCIEEMEELPPALTPEQAQREEIAGYLEEAGFVASEELIADGIAEYQAHGGEGSNREIAGFIEREFLTEEPDTELLEKAKDLINEFCEDEYNEPADFSDLGNVGLAYTTITDEKIPIQVNADLVNFRIERYLNGEFLERRQYKSLEELIQNELEELVFDNLISASEEELESIHIFNGDPASQENYRLLSRLKADCDYFLGAGKRAEKHLWSGYVRTHLDKMRELYAALPEKPEWLSRGIGGYSALDYLIKVKGCSFMEAMEAVAGRAAAPPPSFTSVPREEKPKHLLLPPPAPNNQAMLDYLKGRGISMEVLDFCVQTGRIYESRNKGHGNVVFVGFDKTGKARFGCLRGISEGRFHGDLSGSDKHYSFALPACGKNPAVHLCECAIDVMSYASLCRLDGIDWKQHNLLSLAGVYQPKKKIAESKLPVALTRFLEDYPHVKTVYLHLDNDGPGRMAAEAIQTVISKEYEVKNCPPPRGKDVNDYLCRRLGIPIRGAKGKEQER